MSVNIQTPTGGTAYLRTHKMFKAFMAQDSPENLTSGLLTIGEVYKLGNMIEGDDFTNVGASDNNGGTTFIATGTTPAVWTNGSEISFHAAPTVTQLLINDVGEVTFRVDPLFTGSLLMMSDGQFNVGKTILLSDLTTQMDFTSPHTDPNYISLNNSWQGSTGWIEVQVYQ